ncbi:MAG: hypothetical protein C0627_06510 [Sulfurimonas sp.]|nr:MAG: hypothetical protein C0627_06510 [Sulfurimonas sp.]
MTVNNSNNMYNAYNTYSRNNGSSTRDMESSQDVHVKTDSVTISKEAKELAEADTLPLEAFSLPSWLNEYIPSSSVVGGINRDFWNFVGTMTNDNTLSGGEKAQIKEYLKNDPTHQEMLDKEKFTTQHNKKITDYMTSLQSYFKEALEENGITSKQDYYEKVILNDSYTQKVHQSMMQKMDNDSNIQELMSILGVKS